MRRKVVATNLSTRILNEPSPAPSSSSSKRASRRASMTAPISVAQYWSSRYAQDPANVWLRKIVSETFRDESLRA